MNVLALLLLLTSVPSELPPSREIASAEEAAAFLREHPAAVVLDVRTREEFAEGHLQGAKNLDVQAEDFDDAMRLLPRKATYLVHCVSGTRSEAARAAMEAAGFTSVVHFTGGLQAWTEAGLPVVKDP